MKLHPPTTGTSESFPWRSFPPAFTPRLSTTLLNSQTKFGSEILSGTALCESPYLDRQGKNNMFPPSLEPLSLFMWAWFLVSPNVPSKCGLALRNVKYRHIWASAIMTGWHIFQIWDNSPIMAKAQIWRYLTYPSTNPNFEGTFGDTRNQAHLRVTVVQALGKRVVFPLAVQISALTQSSPRKNFWPEFCLWI